MASALNLTGARFGRLVVTSQIGFHFPNKGHKVALWSCLCDCGLVVTKRQPYLTSGDTKSCGCLRSETTSNLKRSHSLSHRTRTYDTWVLMRQRCNNPKSSGYKYYGGSGVAVCERWDSYKNFLSDMGERPLDKPTLDRISPFGNYEPKNCRWASWKDQANNKKKNHIASNPTHSTTPARLCPLHGDVTQALPVGAFL